MDYRELPYSVEIPTGARSAEVVIAPLDDPLIEGPESVVLRVVPPVCVGIFPPPPDCYLVGCEDTARAVILDNDVTNRPPVVRIVKPEDGDVFLARADIRIAALARDFDGYVTTVEFFEGTNSLGVVTNNPVVDPSPRAPFSIVWSNVPPGRYALTAVATDNDGASTPSKPVEIKVVPRVVPPVVNITAVDPEAAELAASNAGNPAVFSVTRSGDTQSPLLVFYSIGGTASNGVDYRPLTGRLLIPAGAYSNNIFVEPIDDNLVEGVETVVIKLEPSPILTPTNSTPQWWYRIGSNDVARAFIIDNDTLPTNQPPKVAIVRPDDGDVFVAPTDVKLIAVAKDCDGWVRTVEFFDGTNSLGVVTNSLRSTGGLEDGGLDPKGNSPEQYFFLLWKDAPVGRHMLTAKATDNRNASSISDPVRISILQASRPPIIMIVATDPLACEADPRVVGPLDGNPPISVCCIGQKTATFTVFRKGDTNEDLTVFYKLDGSASNGIDYLPLSGEVKIPRGTYSTDIVVVPIDDKLPEPTETVLATLVPIACVAIYPPPPGCYIVGDPNHDVAYIFDNELNQSPKVEIVKPGNGDVFRADSDIEIDVVTRDPDGWVSKMQFYDGTNLIGEQEIFFIIAPPPGQLQKFSMVWSNVPPGDHVLTARATDDSGASSLSDPVRIKVIPLPLLPVVSICAVDPLATEPNRLLPVLPDTAKFTVFRDGNLQSALTVFYRICGSASNSLDYKTLSGQITIPQNSRSADIFVEPVDDELVEGTESVILSLVQPPCLSSNIITSDCYLVGRPDRAIAYIRDNDCPNKPPTVVIVSPPNGAVFAAPLDLRLVAAAEDSDGWVTTVEFFDGDKSLGIVTNTPWIFDTSPVRLPELGSDVLTDVDWAHPFALIWSNVPIGVHKLTALATDNAGGSTRSQPIEITVLESTGLPVVNIMAIDPISREGTDDNAVFRIRRVGSTNVPLTVFYAIRGTASNGVDYVSLPNSVTIPTGRHSARITIQPIDDKLPEDIETVRLGLTAPPYDPVGYEIGRPARASAIILDNDCQLVRTQCLPDGSMHVRLPTPVGMPYRLEASADLLNWQEVVCDISKEDHVSFVEADTDDYPLRFFRVIQDFGDSEDD